jgi:two-component system sensor histidine kinase BarA
MQGEISVQSEENRGTCLRVVLNMAKVDDAAGGPEASSPYAGKSCLLLDDHRLSRLSMRHRLKALGFEVSEGTLTTWPATEKTDPDLLVLGLTGEQLGNRGIEGRVESIRKRIGIPALALLSSSESADLSRIQHAASARCLSRPVAEKTLRRTLAEIISGEASQPAGSEFGITPRLSGYRFLVADDNSINLHLVSSILRESGAEVVEAGNGQEVLNALGHARFDMIFLDMRMPALDGAETARRIRSMDAPARNTPIVAVTADIVPEHRDRALGAGINDYLIKPVDEQQIWEAIRHLLYRGTGAFDGEPLPEPLEETAENTVVDTDMLQAAGRRVLEEELYRRFLDSLSAELNNMYRHCSDRNWMELSESAHRLRGASAVCAVQELELLAGELEQAADDAREDPARKLLKQIDRESRRLIENTAAASGPD